MLAIDAQYKVFTHHNEIMPIQNITVPNLKVLIEKSTDIPAYEQRLSHNHTILEDIYFDIWERMKPRYLWHYLGVGDESVLCLVRLTGTNLVSLPKANSSQYNYNCIFYMNFVSNVSQIECLFKL